MMKRHTLAAFALATAISAPSVAQDATTAARALVVAPSATNAVLRAGTPVTLRLLEEVTTKDKKARVGQRFNMEIAAPVEFNGVTVIPAGSPAVGEITFVKNKGMWGKSGRLEARVLYARVNGRQIRLTGTFDDKGTAGTAAVVGAAVLIPVAGFFLTGTSAVLPLGGEVPAFLDEDVELAMAAVRPAPLVVEQPAPLAAAATEAATAPVE
jgi:hypothetical protein